MNAMPEIVNGGRCVPFVLDEVCTADSAGVVGSYTQFYKEVANQKNDACVCQAGYATRCYAVRSVSIRILLPTRAQPKDTTNGTSVSVQNNVASRHSNRSRLFL